MARYSPTLLLLVVTMIAFVDVMSQKNHTELMLGDGMNEETGEETLGDSEERKGVDTTTTTTEPPPTTVPPTKPPTTPEPNSSLKVASSGLLLISSLLHFLLTR